METEARDTTTQPADATAAEANPPMPAVDGLKAELADAKTKAAEFLDGWQRSRAEFANYKRRQEAELGQLRFLATSDLVRRLLPVIDDFDRAAKTMPDSLKHMTWIEGVMLVHRKLQAVLESEGVKVIEVKPNDEFDPNLHEAISHDESPGIDSGHVIEELQRGYRHSERIIRPTLVRVAR